MSRYTLDAGAVNHARITAGLTLRELAGRTGLSLSTITKACKHGDVSMRSARLVCETLGLRYPEILLNERTGRPWSVGERGLL